MFSVSPIGSCRITTPLRNGQSRHGIRLNLNRCYGYCHSPAEAVQLARFMRGDATIPAEVWPLVSRSHELAKISRQRHVPSHLYVVELSSAKELTIDGVSIQLNYLRLFAADFFADEDRAMRYWLLAAENASDAMADFLGREWSATDRQRIESATLARIRLDFVTRESLRRDVLELARILPDVLFVSHVDARKPDGTRIGSRSAFIDLVRQEVTGLGLNFYNPTDLMEEYGQAAAIEDESTGLAHFTPVFGDAIMDEWMRRHVAPSTDRLLKRNSGAAAERLLGPQVDAAISSCDFARMSSRLEALSNSSDAARAFLGRLAASATEAEAAIRRMAATTTVETAGNLELRDLVATAGRLGLFELALDLAARSKDGLRDLPTFLLIELGHLAAEAGANGDAFEFALAAYTKNSALPRARALLIEISLKEKFNLLAEVTDEQAAEILSGLGPADKLRLLDLNATSPWTAVSDTWTVSDVLGLASHVSERRGIEPAVKIIAAWRHLQGSDRIREDELVALLDEWVASARALKDAADRIRMLSILTEACPRHPEIRAAVRDARLDLVDRMRAAGRDGDLDALETVAVEASALPMPLPELDLWRARLRYDRGEFDEVLKLGPTAREFLSERIGVWVLLMRAALNTNNHGKASEFAGRVVDLACSKTEKLKAEAEAVLSAQPVGT